jgi:hypothetical protein
MTYYQNTSRVSNATDPAVLPPLVPSPKNGSPPSDDGFGGYASTEKTDGEYTTEEDTTLTSQTLNADGTPKRPMNAFMIFARKRRPQLSAENQSMRTGEISKILSKEWNSMPPSEKQYFQDQAKFLKDSFNLKYPDYVYRRRPNNTRNKRKNQGRDGILENGDGHGVEDMKDPTDEDNISLPVPSRSSTYPYQAEPMYRQGSQDPRGVYPLPHDRAGSDGYRSSSRASSVPSPHPPLNQRYPYSSSSAPYNPEASAPVGPGWTETGRMPLPPPSGWYGPDRNYPTSSTTPRNFNSTAPSWPDNHAPSHATGSYSFPTLNSPFYPPTKSDSSAYSESSTSPESTAPPYPSNNDHLHGSRYGGPTRYTPRYDDSPNIPHAPFRDSADQGPDYYSSAHHRPRVHATHSPTSDHSPHLSSHSHLPSSQYSYWGGERGEH